MLFLFNRLNMDKNNLKKIQKLISIKLQDPLNEHLGHLIDRS